MHEHRHVAPRECGLMVRDRVERDTRFRDDAFAVALRDSSVILDPFGLKTALTHARRCGADLVLRLKVDALRFVAAMIYAGVNIQFRSEEHTSELQSLMRISYAVFCLKKKTTS